MFFLEVKFSKNFQDLVGIPMVLYFDIVIFAYLPCAIHWSYDRSGLEGAAPNFKGGSKHDIINVATCLDLDLVEFPLGQYNIFTDLC